MTIQSFHQLLAVNFSDLRFAVKVSHRSHPPMSYIASKAEPVRWISRIQDHPRADPTYRLGGDREQLIFGLCILYLVQSKKLHSDIKESHKT